MKRYHAKNVQNREMEVTADPMVEMSHRIVERFVSCAFVSSIGASNDIKMK